MFGVWFTCLTHKSIQYLVDWTNKMLPVKPKITHTFHVFTSLLIAFIITFWSSIFGSHSYRFFRSNSWLKNEIIFTINIMTAHKISTGFVKLAKQQQKHRHNHWPQVQNTNTDKTKIISPKTNCVRFKIYTKISVETWKIPPMKTV